MTTPIFWSTVWWTGISLFAVAASDPPGTRRTWRMIAGGLGWLAAGYAGLQLR